MIFDDWVIYEGVTEGSGRSEKVWLKNIGTNQIGLFKYNKTEYTFENYSEKIASDLAELLEIPCAKVCVGYYKNRKGCLSHLINNERENLVEGVHLITAKYPHFNANNLKDMDSGMFYSFSMILECIRAYDIEYDIIKMMFFDYLIGNTDRHQSNWAVLKGKDYNFCPLYDNGSSLCFNVSEEKIDLYFGKDINRLNALVVTKSKSLIRLNSYVKTRPTHIEVIQYLCEYYKTQSTEIMENIIDCVNDTSVDCILGQFDNEEMSINRKKLIKKYLKEKVRFLINMKEGEGNV